MKKRKVVILGATGMLGSAVYGVLKDKYDLILAVRSKDKVNLLNKAHGEVDSHKVVELDTSRIYQGFLDKSGYPGDYLQSFLKEIADAEYVINAIGITIPFSMRNEPLTVFINGAFPHLLAREMGEKLIHITTDCVFNGKDGFPYNEKSPKTPADLYGLSKSLGEPMGCITIRTSIIGRELDGFTGLLEWFLSQKGKEINGFANHYWNGITTKQFGKICDEIMSNPDKYPKSGLYHVFSSTVSKYEMVKKFEEKYNTGVKINKDENAKLNRTLSTIYDFNDKLNIPPFDEMVDDL